MNNNKPTVLLISASDFENDSRLKRIHARLLQSDLRVKAIAYGNNNANPDTHLSPIPERSLFARLIDVAKMLGSRALSDNQLLKMLSRRLITKDLTLNSSKIVNYDPISFVVVKHWTSLPIALLIKGQPKIWLDINEVFEAEHDNSKLWALIYKPVILRLLRLAESRIILRSATSLDQIKYMEDQSILHLPNTKEPIPYLNTDMSKNRDIKLLYHGLITTNRALEIVLNALKNSTRDDISLTIRGHGKPNYINSLKALAAELGISNQVHFKPSVPNSELIKIASEHDLGLCLFANESKQLMLAEPNKIYEYMAAGLGIIASETPTMKRMIEDKQIGQLSPINSNQAQVLANILSNLTIDKISKWKEKSYQEALSTWNSNYDWPKLDPFLKQIQ